MPQWLQDHKQPACLIFLFIIKYPNNSTSGEKGFILSHSSSMQPLVAGETRQRKSEAAGPITSIDRKQRERE